MVKYIPIALFFFLMISFTGCVYDQPTADYAKKHKLKNEIYENSKIICIASKNINSQKLTKYLEDAIQVQKNKQTKFLCMRNLMALRAIHRSYDYERCLKAGMFYSRVGAKQNKNFIQMKGLELNIMRYEDYIDVYVDKNIITYLPHYTDYGFDPYAKIALFNGIRNYEKDENFKCENLNK